MMLKIVKVEQNSDFPPQIPEEDFLKFLYNHLGKYGDELDDIKNAIDYAFSSEKGKGGFVLVALKDDSVVGGVVVNDTGMSGYIPEHILVYIATHRNHRGKGIGTELMIKIKEECAGNIALHVEYDNPAVNLYRKVGFTSKYMEMRHSCKDT
jgi:GNAT superfamily N-acetyltransferase